MRYTLTPFDQIGKTKSIHLVIPELSFPNETTIRVNNSEMEINSRSRQSRILAFFWSNPQGILKREHLIEILHHQGLEKLIAAIHFEGSLWKNGHQILSRLRRTMAYCFSKHMPPGTEWLPYLPDLEGWILYKLPGYGSDGTWHA